MKLENVPDPEPADGQVLVRVRAAGVNPVDTYIRSGAYAALPPLPYTPGMDGAGTVEMIGAGVKRFKTGDRVYLAGAISGTYAQLALCKESQVQPLPERISFSQGAGIHVPYATAYRALFQRAHGVPGERLLVHGATGGVGTAAVQIARAAGFEVFGTGGTEKGRELVKQLGAHHVLDHHDPKYVEKLMELTGGRGFDVILEMLANVNLDRDMDMAARGGRIVVIGNRGRIEIDPRKLMGKDASVLGMVLMFASEEKLTCIHAAVYAGLENGTLNPIVGQEFPLDKAPEAHEAVMKPGAFGKIVLIP